MTNTLKPIFTALFKEEWRLQKEIFGGYRFLAFPLVMFGLVTLVGFGLQLDLMRGFETEYLIIGLHAFVFLFGLQTGSILFINRDQFSNLLGEITPVLSMSNIAPTSKRAFVFLFMIKDILYYGVFILLPLSIGLIPILGVPVAISQFVSFVGLFLTGITVTVVLVSLYYRYGKYVLVNGVLALSLLPVLGVLWTGHISGLTIVAPYYLESTSIIQVIANWGILVTLSVLGVVIYKPPIGRSTTTIDTLLVDRFVFVEKYLAPYVDPREELLKKQLTDLQRSSGGFGVVAFSYLIVIGIALGLVNMLEPVTYNISYPLFFGTSLVLGSFTTYTWINEVDDYGEYKHLPITVKEVFVSKEVLFYLFTVLPTVLIVVIATIWNGTIIEGILGVGVVLALSYYQYAIIMSFAGFSPNETLFDGVRFAGLTVAIGIPLMPLLILSLFYPPQYLDSIIMILPVYLVVVLLLGKYVKTVGHSYWTNNLIEGGS